jgi:hypothetical protein
MCDDVARVFLVYRRDMSPAKFNTFSSIEQLVGIVVSGRVAPIVMNNILTFV